MRDGIDVFELAREAVYSHEAEQNPRELAAFGNYLLTHEIARPDGRAANPLRTIVEIGSYRGGSLWFWRRLAPQARIIAIDRQVICEDCSARRAHRTCPRARVHQNADVFMERNSREPGTVATVAEEVGLRELALHGYAGLFPEGAGIDLLFIDGDHSLEGVEADFQNYAPMLSAQGVVAFHDVAGPVARQVGDGKPTWEVAAFWANLKLILPQAFEIAEGHGGGIGVLPKPSPSTAPTFRAPL